jgi:hypothetical protein
MGDGGWGWAEENSGEVRSSQATGVRKGQLGLRGPERTVRRRFELVVRGWFFSAPGKDGETEARVGQRGGRPG